LVPTQCWITAMTKRFIPIPEAEKRRRDEIVDAECSELCEEIWRERPITSADYQVIVTQVIARYPDWFETAKERAEAERQAEAEQKKAEREELRELLVEMGYGARLGKIPSAVGLSSPYAGTIGVP
jgi:hypothetical protein